MRAWVDLSLMGLTFLLTIIWNVEIGIAVSVIVSLLLVVHRSSKTRMTILVSDFTIQPCRTSPHRAYIRAGYLARTVGSLSVRTQKLKRIFLES